VKPLDPRLVREVEPVRAHLAATVAGGAAQAALVVAQAWLLARVISGTGDVIAAVVGVAAVAAVAVTRAVLTGVTETAALRSASRVTSVLRRRLVAHAAMRAASGRGTDAGRVATLATRGLDGLDAYVARYLPQLALAALIPAAVVVVVARADLLSAVVIGVTLPLIPLFMALVGRHTQARTRARWESLERLGGHFLDVVEGLATLAVFRRARAQAELVRRVSDEHRAATMGTLRIAFLSALVLELVATLSVALVAVEVGFRLLYGQLDLATALFVLILAPEAYLPLREVGARFHAAAEGVAAAESVFAELERPGGPAGGTLPVPDDPVVAVRGAGLTHPGRAGPALAGVDLTLAPGTTTLVTGPSGAGKSSLLTMLLGFAAPTAGSVRVGGTDLQALDLAAWRRRIAWVPQQPWLLDASAADNIRLGEPDATDAEVEEAARAAGVDAVLAALPNGYATPLGERGSRLSSGQRQRVALARAFLRRDACRRAGLVPLVLLDEPTAHLDATTATGVRDAATRLLRGATAVVVTHDPAWTADAHLHLHRPAAPAAPPGFAGRSAARAAPGVASVA
jgi:ATP-binding cassette, subfamily C, bacterial CydD